MIKLVRDSHRTWLGNGFGYAPASYTIVRDGEAIGMVWHGVRWNAKFDDGRQLRAETLADLRAKLT